MLNRKIQSVLRQRLADYPAVALVGARQSGKTTLARSLDGVYFDLEQEPDRLRLDLQWSRIAAGTELIVLDEAQEMPEVFVRLRGEIDRDRKRRGRFLLLGSVSPALMTRVSESLAGRLAVVELSPLSLVELPSQAARERHWLCGGFPDGGVLNRRSFPRWQLDYLTLLAQRDLPNWGLPARPQLTRRLMRMLAASHGAEWNASQIGKSLGLSYHTVNGYLEYLEGAFLVRRLPAYHANIRKRLVKRPKLYWRDSGLLHALMNVADSGQLLNQPWVGASWEGFVIEQVITALRFADRAFEPYHLRTSDQREIDLIIETERGLWALEVKLTTRPGTDDMQRLDANADLIKADRRILITRKRELIDDGRRVLCDLDGLLGLIDSG